MHSSPEYVALQCMYVRASAAFSGKKAGRDGKNVVTYSRVRSFIVCLSVSKVIHTVYLNDQITWISGYLTKHCYF